MDTSGKPVGFANVISINDADSSFVAGTTTDVNGLFTISFEPKMQMLKISCVGFDDCFIVPTASNQVIILKESSILLDNVTIRGILPRYKISDEGIRTSVQGMCSVRPVRWRMCFATCLALLTEMAAGRFSAAVPP